MDNKEYARYEQWVDRVIVHYERDRRARKFRRTMIDNDGIAFYHQLRWTAYCEQLQPREFVRSMRVP